MTKVVDPVAEAAKANAQFEAKIDKMVDHLESANNPDRALVHFEAKLEKLGANVSVADPSIQHAPPVDGTPGQHDVFIYNYAAHVDSGNIGVRDFTPGEDYIVLANMNGKAELDINTLGNNLGSWAVFFHSYPDTHGSFGTSTALSMPGVPYNQDVLQHMILGVSDIKYESAFDIG